MPETRQKLELKQPVCHAALDMLDETGAAVEDIDGTDAPGVVVQILPVEQAILPVAAVVVPPLARRVFVLLAVGVQGNECHGEVQNTLRGPLIPFFRPWYCKYGVL